MWAKRKRQKSACMWGKMDKCKFKRYHGVPNGTTESPRTFMDRNCGGKHSRQESGNITGIVLETNMTRTRDQGCSKVITTRVDKVVTKSPEELEQLEDQVWETDSPKERSKAWTRVKAMLNWSLGLVLVIICFTDTVDVTTISLDEGCQEILQTKSIERQYMERPLMRYGNDWNPCAGN